MRTANKEKTPKSGVSGGRSGLDNFGHSLSIGDYNRVGIADLLIGEPGEDVQTNLGKREYAGVVHVLNGSYSGLRGNDFIFTQVPSGSMQDEDMLGWSLP